MTVAVHQPPTRQKRDPLDIIQQGLQIAAAFYGIKTDMAKMDEYQASRADAKKRIDLENKKLEAETTALSDKKPTAPKQVVDTVWDPQQKKNVLLSRPENAALAAGYEPEHKGPSETSLLAGMKHKEARDELDRKIADEKAQKYIPGVGYAATLDDAKKAKDTIQTYKQLKENMAELIDLRQEFGGEVINRDAVAKAKQVAALARVQYKDLANLGVLSKDDYKIIDSVIPEDPLQFDLGTTMAQLKNFDKKLDTNMSSFFITRGIGDEQSIAKFLSSPGARLVDSRFEQTGNLNQQFSAAQRAAAMELLMEQTKTQQAGR